MHIQLFGIKSIFLRLFWNVVFINFISGTSMHSDPYGCISSSLFFYSFVILLYLFYSLLFFPGTSLIYIFCLISSFNPNDLFSYFRNHFVFFLHTPWQSFSSVPLILTFAMSSLLFIVFNEKLIICCFLSFLNSPVNLCLLWAATFSSLPLALWASQLKQGRQSGLEAWPQSLCHLLPGSTASLHKSGRWEDASVSCPSGPGSTRLNRMAPGFLLCGRHTFLCLSSAEGFLCFFFSGSFQRSGIQECKRLIPISFYPEVCKKHSSTFS